MILTALSRGYLSWQLTYLVFPLLKRPLPLATRISLVSNLGLPLLLPLIPPTPTLCFPVSETEHGLLSLSPWAQPNPLLCCMSLPKPCPQDMICAPEWLNVLCQVVRQQVLLTLSDFHREDFLLGAQCKVDLNPHRLN